MAGNTSQASMVHQPHEPHSTGILAGKSLLVVEHDLGLAQRICQHLKANGAAVIGPAPTLHYARLIIGKRRLDGAILTVGGVEASAFAHMLAEDGVPILFAHGNGPGDWGAQIEAPSGGLCLDSLTHRIAALEPLTPKDRKPAAPPRPSRSPLSLQERFARTITRAVRAVRE